MADSNEERAARLQHLNAYYGEQLPDKIAAIEEVGLRLENEGWSDDLVRQLKFRCHNLEGTGTTFGFRAVTETARSIGEHLRRFDGGTLSPGPDDIRQLATLIADLRRAACP